MKNKLLLCAALLILPLASCEQMDVNVPEGPDEEIVAVSAITISEPSLALIAGQQVTLTATVHPDDAWDKTITWTSSNTSVATVDGGLVIAMKEGEADIKASAGGKEAICKVVVSRKIIPVESVIIDPTSLTLTKGQSESLKVTVYPDDATDKTVVFESSDESVAAVSEDGKVTALKSGVATVYAKAGDKSGTCTVTVSTPVESITLSSDNLVLEVGQSIVLAATVTPDDADDRTVTWTSSDVSVATVNNGTVVAVKEGQAEIIASAGGMNAVCRVAVYNAVIPVESIVLSQNTLSLVKGQSEVLTATVSPDDATDKTVTWESSDVSIATVLQDGTVTALKSGTAFITAKAGDCSATCEIKVSTPVEGITLNTYTLQLEEGQDFLLTAQLFPDDADETELTWTSANPAIATVNAGYVVAVKEGTAVISVEAGTVSASCTVIVSAKYIPVTGITLNETMLIMTEGDQILITATVYPENATDKTVTWSSDVETVATVENGLVRAISEGSTNIIAKAGDFTAICPIIVNPAPVVLTGITFGLTELTLTQGQRYTLTVSPLPSDATLEGTVEWISSNESVVTVSDSGELLAVNPGTSVVTATSCGFSASCTITVEGRSGDIDGTTFEDWN